MGALHIRNVPPDVVEALKARAAKEGRSLNAQVVHVLVDATRRCSLDEVLARIDARSRRAALPASAPTPESLIRRDRDAG
jgi:plasmid stability protein